MCANVGLIGHGDQTFEGFVGPETSVGAAGIGDVQVSLLAAWSPGLLWRHSDKHWLEPPGSSCCTTRKEWVSPQALRFLLLGG